MAGKADGKAVANALRTMDLSDGPADYFAGGRIKFETNGRRAGASLLIVQWQKRYTGQRLSWERRSFKTDLADTLA